MKYTPERKRTITGIKRVSKPGLRVYSKADSVAAVSSAAWASRFFPPTRGSSPIGKRESAGSVAKSSATSGGAERCPDRQEADPHAERRRSDGQRHPRGREGPQGPLERDLVPDITVTREGDELIVTRPSDERQHRALHGLTRSLVDNMVSASRTVSPGSWRSSASATGPRPRARTSSSWPSGFSPRGPRRRPRRDHVRGGQPDPDRRPGLQQGARRPGGGQHPQASASPSPTRARASGTPGSAFCARPARPGRSRRDRDGMFGAPSTRQASPPGSQEGERLDRPPTPGRVPVQSAHLRPGHRRHDRAHPRRRLHRGGRPARPVRPAPSTPPRRSASSLASGPRPPASPAWSSTAAGSATTAASPPSATAHARPDSRFKEWLVNEEAAAGSDGSRRPTVSTRSGSSRSGEWPRSSRAAGGSRSRRWWSWATGRARSASVWARPRKCRRRSRRASKKPRRISSRSRWLVRPSPTRSSVSTAPAGCCSSPPPPEPG